MRLHKHIALHHTSHSHKCMGVNEEALQLHAVFKKSFYHENTYQYYKSHVLRLNVK